MIWWELGIGLKGVRKSRWKGKYGFDANHQSQPERLSRGTQFIELHYASCSRSLAPYHLWMDPRNIRTSLKGWSIQGDFLVPAQAQSYSESQRHDAGKPYGPRLLHVWLFYFELMPNGRAQWTLDKRARKRARPPRRPNCYHWSISEPRCTKYCLNMSKYVLFRIRLNMSK